MAKHDAVDRLMAMATEKRADRMPTAPTSADAASRAVAAETTSGATLEASLPPALIHAEDRRPGAGERGRQVLQAIRPLLPAVAGAMRLVDHGAVQAFARLLPLLGASLGNAAAAPAKERAAEERGSEALLGFQTEQQGQRRRLDAVEARADEQTDELRRVRNQMERIASEETGRALELRGLTDRVRLLTATTIILLMLVVAQMILLIFVFHR